MRIPALAAPVAFLAAAGMWQTPTLVNERRHLLGSRADREVDPRFAYVHVDARRLWGEGLAEPTEGATTQEVVSVLAAAGVPFLAGTDLGNPGVYPGFSLHDELELLVAAGLTRLQAL